MLFSYSANSRKCVIKLTCQCLIGPDTDYYVEWEQLVTAEPRHYHVLLNENYVRIEVFTFLKQVSDCGLNDRLATNGTLAQKATKI